MAELEDVQQALKERHIASRSIEHLPVFTTADAEKYWKDLQGLHCKNLFLKSRKNEQFYLLILAVSKRADLSKLGRLLDDKITVASPDELWRKLQLKPGSVSPFGLLNNKEQDVMVLIDEEVWNAPLVGFHPNINTATLELSGQDFQRFLQGFSNKKKVLACPAASSAN